LFRQNIVCIEEYDGLSDPESVDLNSFATCIQIHKLPVGYRNGALIKNLTEKKVGKVIGKVETNLNGVGNFVRVRVKLNVAKPLARFVTVSRAGQREFCQIKYEKMPKFCGACGYMGHTHLECGSGEHDEEKLKWGDFLKADWSTWKGRNLGGNRGGGRSSRGGRSPAEWDAGTCPGGNNAGRGRGNFSSWRYNALAYSSDKDRVEGVLEDTGTSPLKNNDDEMDHENSDFGAKRRLNLNNISDDLQQKEDLDLPAEMALDGAVPELMAPGEKGMTKRAKRSKKDGANSPSLGSTGSFEGSVWSQ
jgi:hypothetical protein